MEEIYVPKDFSELRIILPPNEEVIYSTLCTIRFSYKIYSTLRGGTVKKRVKYNSHVLITQKGLAYFCLPLTFSGSSIVLSEPEPRYNTLLNVFNVEEKIFKVFHTDYSEGTTYNFELIQHPNYESNSTYNERIKKFRMILTPFLINTAKTFLAYILENKDQERKNDSPLWKLDFFGSNTLTLDQSTKEVIESAISAISNKKRKREASLRLTKTHFDNLHKIAYVKYILEEGKFQSIPSLKKFNRFSYEPYEFYIDYLKKLITKHTKYIKKLK